MLALDFDSCERFVYVLGLDLFVGVQQTVFKPNPTELTYCSKSARTQTESGQGLLGCRPTSSLKTSTSRCNISSIWCMIIIFPLRCQAGRGYNKIKTMTNRPGPDCRSGPPFPSAWSSWSRRRLPVIMSLRTPHAHAGRLYRLLARRR